ncbi:MAG: hypothetical protein RSC98_05200 [Clostridia bacterium]
MKKGIALLLCILLLAGSACAEVVLLKTPFEGVELTLDAPENTTVEQSIDNEMVIIHVSYLEESTADYHIILAKSDLEGIEGRSLTDLTDAEVTQLAASSANEMEDYKFYTDVLENGMTFLVLDEAGDKDEQAGVYTLIQGYLLGVRSDYHESDKTITKQDYLNTIDLLGRMTLTVK